MRRPRHRSKTWRNKKKYGKFVTEPESGTPVAPWKSQRTKVARERLRRQTEGEE